MALALILALLGGFVFYRTEIAATGILGSAGSHVDRLVRDAFQAVAHLQPRVTVDEHVVFEQTSPVLELAVVEREIAVERDTADTWLGSTKHIRLRAVYRVKAGFDLRQPFDVRVEGAKITGRLPPARLLSTEQVRLEAMDLRDGMWNRVDPEELKAEINRLNTEARLKALSAGLTREAESSLAAQLRGKLGPGYPIDITFSPAPLPSPTSGPLR